MKMVTPQALPEGESSSAGIMVSATAEKKAASAAVNVRSASSFNACGAAPSTGLGCWASAGVAGVSPAATAVPAPNRKLRRAIDAVSSVVWSSAIETSLWTPFTVGSATRPALFVVWNKTKPICATAGRGSIPFAARARRTTPPKQFALSEGAPKRLDRRCPARASSRRHERALALEVFRRDGVCRPVGEPADETRWIVGGVLRKQRRAHDEKIVGVPGLAVAIDRAGLRIRAHHGAAGVVRRLVGHHVVIAPAHIDVAFDRRLHRGRDAIEHRAHVLRHLVIVVAEIVAHADERPAERILVGRIEIEKILAVRVVAAGSADGEGVIVPFRRCLLPLASPTRRARRHRPREDRAAVGGAGRNPGAAEEAET